MRDSARVVRRFSAALPLFDWIRAGFTACGKPDAERLLHPHFIFGVKMMVSEYQWPELVDAVEDVGGQRLQY